MERRILKYYKDSVGRPLFCVLVIVGKYDASGEGDYCNVCSVSFTMPYFLPFDYPKLESIIAMVQATLENDTDANVDHLLDDLGKATMNIEDINLLYFPDFLISKDNKVLWDVFNCLSNGKEHPNQWIQLIFNLDDALGKATVFTDTVNSYLYNVALYYIKKYIDLKEFVESEMKNFMHLLSDEYRDVVLDNYNSNDMILEEDYNSERSSGKMFIVLNQKRRIKLVCCLDD